jgi:transposase
MRSHQKSSDSVAVIGIDIGKNTFHLVGLNQRRAIVLRIKVSRSQLERWLANVPRCLVGLEAGCGSHHIARQIRALGHDVRLLPAPISARTGVASRNESKQYQAKSRPGLRTTAAVSA